VVRELPACLPACPGFLRRRDGTRGIVAEMVHGLILTAPCVVGWIGDSASEVELTRLL
jgi:hypothetical protein